MSSDSLVEWEISLRTFLGLKIVKWKRADYSYSLPQYILSINIEQYFLVSICFSNENEQFRNYSIRLIFYIPPASLAGLISFDLRDSLSCAKEVESGFQRERNFFRLSSGAFNVYFALLFKQSFLNWKEKGVFFSVRLHTSNCLQKYFYMESRVYFLQSRPSVVEHLLYLPGL